MTDRNNAKKVYVAMSGGVDSSVAAFLLVESGHSVTGVFMKPWQPKGFACMWEQDRADALRVATSLNIPFETWDFSREYAHHVSKPMVDAYRRGSTPNPDVECNRHIKFGLFYRKALQRGADAIATGHYARIARGASGYALRTAKDTDKDQTYFLWGLNGTQLPRIIFPVGGMLKSEVRAHAARAGLATATKKDSQGVCFVGQLDMKSFLTSAIPQRQGLIKYTDGHIVGTHDGAGYYTIGQRHGLDIKDGAGPYFVVSKNMKKNEIVVGPESALLRRSARVSSLHWIGNPPPKDARLKAKVRYRSAAVSVVRSGGMLRFARPVKALAAGQSVVFYQGTRVVGGGVLR